MARKGRRRSRSRGEPLLVIIEPPNRSPSVSRLSKRCAEEGRNRGFGEPKVYQALRQPLVGASARKVLLLSRRDASRLYGQMHRSRVLVCAFGTVLVRRNPARDPAAGREVLKLATFVSHKAPYQLVRGDEDVSIAFAEFEDWCAEQKCTGENDPRILPLHVFETACRVASLGTQAGDTAFYKRHGASPRRVDDGGKSWKRAQHSEYHGGDRLTIAGFELLAGMHWDVSGKASVHTSTEIWKLEGRHPYLNIYPDAWVRRTDRSTARLAWSASD